MIHVLNVFEDFLIIYDYLCSCRSGDNAIPMLEDGHIPSETARSRKFGRLSWGRSKNQQITIGDGASVRERPASASERPASVWERPASVREGLASVREGPASVRERPMSAGWGYRASVRERPAW